MSITEITAAPDDTWCDSCEKDHDRPDRVRFCDPDSVYAELRSCVQGLAEPDDRHARLRAISGAQAMLAQLLRFESSDMLHEEFAATLSG